MRPSPDEPLNKISEQKKIQGDESGRKVLAEKVRGRQQMKWERYHSIYDRFIGESE